MYIPEGATNFTMRMISRSQSLGGGTVSLELYAREVRVGAIESWNSNSLSNITLGADANFDFHDRDVSVDDLGVQPGRYVQFELVRDGAGSMTGDWSLLGIEVFFS